MISNLTLLLALILSTPPQTLPEQAVGKVLDDFHRAAADAAEERYFGHFAADAVFLGTDPSERWTVEEFRRYAHPRFDAGRGWTYTPRQRHVTIAAGGELAWFDEMLTHERYGDLRGSGVLRWVDGTWKVAQYNLTFTVPNEVTAAVVAIIRGEKP